MKKIRILMIEGSHDDAERIQRELKRDNMEFDARIVSERPAYEQALEEFHPDIILSDNSIVNFNSMDALKTTRARNLNVPFILVTGAVSEEFAVESMKAGADDYILKSGLRKLPEAIRSAMDRKRTEKESAEALERYKMILDMMPAGCMMLDTDLHFTYWNPQAEKMFGYRSREVIGKNITQTIAPFTPENSIREIFRDKANTDSMMENVTREGKKIICEWRNTVLTDLHGQCIGILSTCVDVTEKVETEKEVLKFASIVENSTEFIAMAGVKGNVIYLNKAGCSLVGIDKEEARTRLISDFFFREDFSKLVSEVIPSIVNNGNWKGEFRLVDQRTGKTIPVNLVGYLIRDPKHVQPVALAIIAHDVSRHKEAEGRLVESKKQLQATLGELNTFIYRASHDLRGPLASIAGLLELAGQEIKDEHALMYINMVKESTTRLGSILNGLIETMRVRESRPTAEKVDFETLIDQNIGQFRFRKDFEKIRINVKVKVEKPFYSYRTILNSVLQNLVENAIKYHNTARENPFINISVTDSRNGVRIVVEDNGFGMNEEVQKRIFEMYYRGHEGSTGTGLGLYIVKTAVDRMNGTIEVSSEVGKGSKFTIYLPSLGKN